jgi:hypothetical protein
MTGITRVEMVLVASLACLTAGFTPSSQAQTPRPSPAPPPASLGFLTGFLWGAGSLWPSKPYSADVMPFPGAVPVAVTARLPFKTFPGGNQLAVDLDLGYAKSSAEAEGDFQSSLPTPGPASSNNEWETVRTSYSDVYFRTKLSFVIWNQSRSKNITVGAGLSAHVISGTVTTRFRGNLFLRCPGQTAATSYDCTSSEPDAGTDVGLALSVGADFRLSARMAITMSASGDISPHGGGGEGTTYLVTDPSGNPRGTMTEPNGLSRNMVSLNVGVRFAVGK